MDWLITIEGGGPEPSAGAVMDMLTAAGWPLKGLRVTVCKGQSETAEIATPIEPQS